MIDQVSGQSSADDGVTLDFRSDDFYDELAHAFFASGGIGAQTIVGVSDKECEQLFAFAKMLYEGSRYAQASDVFGYLARLAPSDQRYIKSLGMARQMLKDYDGAVTAYSIAAVLDIEDAEPSIHAAECLLHLGEIGRARAAIKGAYLQIAARAVDNDLMQKLNALQDAINRYDKKHNSNTSEDKNGGVGTSRLQRGKEPQK